MGVHGKMQDAVWQVPSHWTEEQHVTLSQLLLTQCDVFLSDDWSPSTLVKALDMPSFDQDVLDMYNIRGPRRLKFRRFVAELSRTCHDADAPQGNTRQSECHSISSKGEACVGSSNVASIWQPALNIWSD